MAEPGDEVEFKVALSALENPVLRVTIRDALGAGLELTGTVYVGPHETIMVRDFMGIGIRLDELKPEELREFKFKAVVAEQFPVGTHDLVNRVTAFSSITDEQVQDEAVVRVTVEPPPPPEPKVIREEVPCPECPPPSLP